MFYLKICVNFLINIVFSDISFVFLFIVKLIFFQHLLPKERQEEYMRLKKIIDEKEKQKQQQPQKYLGNKLKSKETLSVSTNHKIINNSTIPSKDRNIKQTWPSSSSSECKSVNITRDNPNVCIPKESICNEKEDEGGALVKQSQRDITNIKCHTKPSMVQFPLREKTTFMSKVENYLKKCLETSDKSNKTKLIKEYQTELSNDVGMLKCKETLLDVGNCVKTPEKIVSQHFEINNGLNECKKQTNKKTDQKSNDIDKMESNLVNLKDSNKLNIAPLTKFVAENLCENIGKNCQSIEPGVTNLSSSLHHVERINSTSSSTDKAHVEGVLTKASETLQSLGKGLAGSQKILENDVGISTTESLQDSPTCSKQHDKSINKSIPLSLESSEHYHDTINFQTSSNYLSIENLSISVRNDSLDKELLGNEMTSSEVSSNNCRRLSNSADKEFISSENNATHMSMESITDSKLEPLIPHLISNNPSNSTDSDLLFSKQEELLCER